MGLGLNQGGAGVARFLAKQGARVLITDLKTKKELASSLKQLKGLPIKYVLGQHRAQDFEKADLIIQNPAVPDASPYLKIAHKHKIPVETDMGLFFQLCPSKNIIGVTGTKVKSTTASLIAHILKTAKKDVVLAGNIGLSVLDALPKTKQGTFVVLELSSWQLEGLARHKISPPVAVLTNILPDHLNRYKNFTAYSRAKQLILKYQKPGDIAVLNKNDKEAKKMGLKAKSKVLWYSSLRVQPCKTGLNPPKDTLPSFLQGTHNLSNILAATTVARAFSIDETITKKALATFKGLPHRMEVVAQHQGVTFINDSAATNPAATMAALQSFSNPLILIAGGQDKNLDYNALGKAVAKGHHIRHLVLLSHPAYDASRKIYEAVKKYDGTQKITLAFTMEEAVEVANHKSPTRLPAEQVANRKNDKRFAICHLPFAILLSPAAASLHVPK